MFNRKYLCTSCLIIDKGTNICGRCGTAKCAVNKKARAPKKDAKAKEWVEFADLFLKDEAKEHLLTTIGKVKEKEEAQERPKSEKLKHNLHFEIVEFLVDFQTTTGQVDIKETLRNGRGFNKWTLKDLLKEFDKSYKDLIGFDLYKHHRLMEKGDLICSLIFEKEFDL